MKSFCLNKWVAAGLLGSGLLTSVALAQQGPRPASALQSELGLASALPVAALLLGSTAQQAAGHLVDAEKAGLQQARAGSAEWVLSTGVARVSDAGPPAVRSTDWEFGIERALRLPGKAGAQERAAQARVALAQSQRQTLWQEQAAGLVRALVDWRREQLTVSLWQAQVALMQTQEGAVARRRRLGDAAEIEQLQARLAREQAQALASAAQSRLMSAGDFLRRRYPNLVSGTPGDEADALQPGLGPDPSSAGSLPTLEEWLAEARRLSPALSVRRREAEALQAQAQAERLEQRPDPTLGLRWGRARQGQEQTVGLVLSVPFGGEFRRAGAEASALRAAAAVLQAEESAQAWQADAIRRYGVAQAARAAWVHALQAQQQLQAVAERLARGYALGEGSLADVLAARRLANDQALMAVNAAMDDLAGRALLALEAGQLWPQLGG